MVPLTLLQQQGTLDLSLVRLPLRLAVSLDLRPLPVRPQVFSGPRRPLLHLEHLLLLVVACLVLPLPLLPLVGSDQPTRPRRLLAVRLHSSVALHLPPLELQLLPGAVYLARRLLLLLLLLVVLLLVPLLLVVCLDPRRRLPRLAPLPLVACSVPLLLLLPLEQEEVFLDLPHRHLTCSEVALLLPMERHHPEASSDSLRLLHLDKVKIWALQLRRPLAVMGPRRRLINNKVCLWEGVVYLSMLRSFLQPWIKCSSSA